MASCARVPFICMVRAEELRKEEEEQLKEEIAEVKEEVGEEEEEKDVVMELMFENAMLKTRVMELELECSYLQHKLAVANRERRRRVKRLHTRLCSRCLL